MSDSRTQKSILNAKITLFFSLAVLGLNFFSRKVFLNYLGTEILGLNTTITNLLAFLNLAELGVGIAVAYALYQPLFSKNYTTINEIISVQGYWYKKIGLLVIAGSLIIMLFFPLMFAKTEVPLIYTYLTFIALLSNSLLGYFWNYKQIVLSADQKQYKIIANKQSWTIAKVILQILAVTYLPDPYIYWIALEFLFSILATISLSRLIKREYPWLDSSIKAGKALQNKYPEIITKTKQLFFHKISTFSLYQISPLILYFFTSLTFVAIYGNYILITAGIIQLLGAVFSSTYASVGNLVAQNNKDRILDVFWELFSLRFIFVTTTCVGMYYLSAPLITLWLGADYVLSNTSLLLIVIVLYINTMRTIVDTYVNAYGLYRDIWATITEAVINISCSILLGYYWGLNGILLGTIISLGAIVFVWKPYFCFTSGMQTDFKQYVIRYAKFIIIFSGVILIANYAIKWITIDPYESFLNLVLYASIVTAIYLPLILLSLLCLDKATRRLTLRFRKHFKP